MEAAACWLSSRSPNRLTCTPIETSHGHAGCGSHLFCHFAYISLSFFSPSPLSPSLSQQSAFQPFLSVSLPHSDPLVGCRWQIPLTHGGLQLPWYDQLTSGRSWLRSPTSQMDYYSDVTIPKWCVCVLLSNVMNKSAAALCTWIWAPFSSFDLIPSHSSSLGFGKPESRGERHTGGPRGQLMTSHSCIGSTWSSLISETHAPGESVSPRLIGGQPVPLATLMHAAAVDLEPTRGASVQHKYSTFMFLFFSIRRSRP